MSSRVCSGSRAGAQPTAARVPECQSARVPGARCQEPHSYAATLSFFQLRAAFQNHNLSAPPASLLALYKMAPPTTVLARAPSTMSGMPDAPRKTLSAGQKRKLADAAPDAPSTEQNNARPSKVLVSESLREH